MYRSLLPAAQSELGLTLISDKDIICKRIYTHSPNPLWACAHEEHTVSQCLHTSKHMRIEYRGLRMCHVLMVTVLLDRLLLLPGQWQQQQQPNAI